MGARIARDSMLSDADAGLSSRRSLGAGFGAFGGEADVE
jgi:hypothetical protein